MTDMSLQFQQNMNEERTQFSFTPSELKGLPEDMIDALEVDPADPLKQRRFLSLKYPHYVPAMKHLVNDDVRRKLQTAFDSRCKDTNAPLLVGLTQRRAQVAALLGYPHHAAYITEVRMAGSADRVHSFLEDLTQRLEPLVQAEMRDLLELKRAHCEERGQPFDGVVRAWDFRYLVDKYEKARFQVSPKPKRPSAHRTSRHRTDGRRERTEAPGRRTTDSANSGLGAWLRCRTPSRSTCRCRGSWRGSWECTRTCWASNLWRCRKPRRPCGTSMCNCSWSTTRPRASWSATFTWICFHAKVTAVSDRG